MGMLMHHTWLKQQKKKAEKPVAENKTAVAVEETEEPKAPAKTGGRRKTSK